MKIRSLSAQQHRRFDQFALPGLVGFAIYMTRRNKAAGAFAVLLLMIEGTGLVMTDYPPGMIPMLSFRDHVHVGLLTPWMIAAAVCLSPNIPATEKKILLGMAVVPLLVNGFSDTESGS